MCVHCNFWINFWCVFSGAYVHGFSEDLGTEALCEVHYVAVAF